MARFFSQSNIDEFKECFFYHARRGYVANDEELLQIMRSLDYSPTKDEGLKYFQKYGKDESRIDFASFLEVMHEHSLVEQPEKEILQAFKAHDKEGRGYVPASELRGILTRMGETLTRREVDSLLQEANVAPNGQVQYTNFIKSILTPAPDY